MPRLPAVYEILLDVQATRLVPNIQYQLALVLKVWNSVPGLSVVASVSAVQRLLAGGETQATLEKPQDNRKRFQKTHCS